MGGYIARRLLQLPIALLVVGTLAFVLIHLAPGGPLVALSGEFASDEVRREIEALYGLDRSLPAQYLAWLGKVAAGDLGVSYLHKAPVLQVIGERLPVTLSLILPAAILASLAGAALGVVSTPAAGKRQELAAPVTSLVAHSVPTFWLAQALVVVFALWLGWLPVQGLDDVRADAPTLGSRIRHLILPVTTLAVHQMALTALTLRASLHGEMRRGYVTTALAKGLTVPEARRRHALINALLPLISILGGRLGGAFVGAIGVEMVFALPGLGRLIVSAAVNRDHPLVIGLALLVCAAAMLGNIVTDLVMNRLDPRLGLGARR